MPKLIFHSVVFVFLLGVFCVGPVRAEDEAVLLQDKQEVLKARVVDVLAHYQEKIPGTENIGTYQKLRVEILEGEQKGKFIEINNDYISLEEEQVFYAIHTVHADTGKEFYVVGDYYRLPQIILFLVIFFLIILIFGGIQGIRGILALLLSFLVILYVLLPGIIQGFSPIVVTVASSFVIIVCGSYLTHGFNKTTSSAVIGMIITVLFTGFLAWFAVKTTMLSGFENEEAVYLNLNTKGIIDFQGLLFGGIMIGLLGVLYDVAIGQAVSVEELFRAGLNSKKAVYKRAIRIGREHIGALVNTLAIAYVGTSLPLLLLFFNGSYLSTSMIISKEIFASEIIRTLVGSVGLVLGVPITTLVSVFMLEKYKNVSSVNGRDNHSHTH